MDWITERIRGAIYQLRSGKTGTKDIADQLQVLLKEIESSPRKYEPIRFALSALMHSVKRGESGNYYIIDSELFIWAMDELDRITQPINLGE